MLRFMRTLFNQKGKTMMNEVLEKLQERLDDIKKLTPTDYHQGLQIGMQLAMDIVRGCIEKKPEPAND